MNFKNSLFTLSLLLISCMLFAQDENDVHDYIEKFKGYAIAEQMRMGVPAAITLAQGIHESAAGKSELATKGNNHFGIKCKTTWMGETMLHDDDKKQECFRKYPSAEQSYIDHSDFLKSSNRYHFLFDLERTDYAGWASGLKRAGYATNPQYVKVLTDLVEKYNLQQYTYEAISKSNTTVGVGEFVPNDDKPRNLTQVDDPSTYYKGLKGFWAVKGETLLPKALEKNIRYAKLLSLNDLADEPLQTDMFVFIEKKRKIGTEEFHVVKANESMLLIAQKEAMLLSNLYAYNNLVPGQEPEIGERLALQYKSYETPKTKQQFLKEFEQPKTLEPVIARVEEKKIVKQATAPEKKVIHEKEKIKAIVKEEAPTEKQPEKIEPEQKIVAIEKEKIVAPAEQEIKKQTLVSQRQSPFDVPPVRQENTTPNEGIVDPEKAKRMEQLLNSKPLDGRNENIVMAEPTVKKENINATSPAGNESPFSNRSEPVKQEALVIEAPIPPPAEITSIPAEIAKRKYDEPDVDDSVKLLKKMFDPIVYAQRPARKIELPKQLVPDVKNATPVPVKKEDDKKSNVHITPTGLKRDLRKPSASSSRESTTIKESKTTPSKNKWKAEANLTARQLAKKKMELALNSKNKKAVTEKDKKNTKKTKDTKKPSSTADKKVKAPKKTTKKK